MKIKNVIVLDVESYWDREEVTLRKLSPPEYIFHPKFSVTLLAAYDIKWDTPKIIDAHEIADFLAQYDPATTMSISHNALFDNSVFAWKYGWVPVRMCDTLGLARALRTYPRYSLGAVAKELFGHNSKGDVIGKVAGLDIQRIKNAGLWSTYSTYAMNDARICMQIFLKLWPEFPVEERKVMDLVLRCAVTPVLHADTALLEAHLTELRRRKAELLRESGYDKASLMSMVQFRTVLEGLGVEIKSKISPAGKWIPQFSKTDPFMTDLLHYDKAIDADTNYQVQTLAAARLSQKSTIEETRTERFLNIARLPWGNGAMLPVALRYGGAHTHRLSGEWKLNMQNLPRDKAKSKLRQALVAPEQFKIVTADLAQIEARIVAVLCGEDKLVEAFRRGDDVYAQFATLVFNRVITKAKNPNERFLGKTAILGLGYGCGPDRYYQMVTTQARQNNISLDGIFSEDIARSTVGKYRTLFSKISMAWRLLDSALARIINSPNDTQSRKWGPVTFRSGCIELPNRLFLRYQRNDPQLYGAKLLENIVQALARIVVMQAAVRLAQQGLRFILQAHDELVFVVADDRVKESSEIISAEMIREPKWLPGLPLAVEIGVGQNYGEAK